MIDESIPQYTLNLAGEADLLAVIEGTGRKRLGPGLRTYPTSPDNHQQRLHQLCERLEARGMIRRSPEGSAVLWTSVRR